MCFLPPEISSSTFDAFNGTVLAIEYVLVPLSHLIVVSLPSLCEACLNASHTRAAETEMGLHLAPTLNFPGQSSKHQIRRTLITRPLSSLPYCLRPSDDFVTSDQMRAPCR